MSIWILVFLIQGILASASSTDASKLARKRGGYDEKDAYYLNNHYSPDTEHDVPRPRPVVHYHDRGPYPDDNGQEPSLKKEFVILPNRVSESKGDKQKVREKETNLSVKLAKILPLVKFTCQGRQEGYYADVDFDCTVFHFCSAEQVRYTFLCGGNGKFNQRHLICDYQLTTNCSEAYLTNSINDRKHIFQNSKTDKADDDTEDYEELPELVRTKRIGNDFSEPEEFSHWDEKFDPLRFKRSARVRRYTLEDSSEDLLAMSSEPSLFQEQFTERAGTVATNDQWRSTGIHLPNHRRNFSPFMPPHQAAQASRQSLHNFRQEAKNFRREDEPLTYQQPRLNEQIHDRGAPRAEPEYYRPHREASVRNFVETDEHSYPFEVYRGAEQQEPRRNTDQRRRQQHEAPKPEYSRPSSFGNFFESSDALRNIDQQAPSPMVRPITLEKPFVGEDFNEHTPEPTVPKQKKQKKRPQYEDEYQVNEPDHFGHSHALPEEEIAVKRPIASTVRDEQTRESTSREQEQFRKPVNRPSRPSERPIEDLRYDVTEPNHPQPNHPHFRNQQPVRPMRPRPSYPPHPKEANSREGFGMSKMVSGIKNFVANTLAPISTTQASARQRRPEHQSQRPSRPWGEENPPNTGRARVQHNQPQFINEPRDQSQTFRQNSEPLKAQSAFQTNKKDWIPEAPQLHAPREQAQPLRPNYDQPKPQLSFQNDKRDWVPEAPQSLGRNKVITNSLDVDTNLPKSAKQPDLREHIHAVSPVEARLVSHNVPEKHVAPAKVVKKKPVNQDLPDLSWASIFNDAESYESYEEPSVTESSFRPSQPITSEADDVPTISPKQSFEFKAKAPPTTEAPENAVEDIPPIEHGPSLSAKMRPKPTYPKVTTESPEKTPPSRKKSKTKQPLIQDPLDLGNEETSVPVNNKNFRRTTPAVSPEVSAFIPTEIRHEEVRQEDMNNLKTESKVERLSNYKKRIETQRDRARQRTQTTSEGSPIEDTVTEPTKELVSEKFNTVKEPETESATRVKFPQRTRVRSKVSTESQASSATEETVHKEINVHNEDIVQKEVTVTITSTTPSPRKTFDLNKFRTSNRFNYPKLRNQNSEIIKPSAESNDHTNEKQSSPKDNTSEAAEVDVEDDSETKGSPKRKPGRKRFGGYRRRTSTTPGTVEDDNHEHDEDNEAHAQIQEISEVNNSLKEEKKHFKRQEENPIKESHEDNKEDLLGEGSSTTTTEVVHTVISQDTEELEESAEKKANTAEENPRNTDQEFNFEEPEQETAIEVVEHDVQSTKMITEVESGDDLTMIQEDTSISSERVEEVAQEEKDDVLINIKDGAATSFGRFEKVAKEEKEEPTVTEDAYQEETQTRLVLPGESTSLDRVLVESNEENNVSLPDIDDDQDSSPPKFERKPHLVTNADNVSLPDIDDEQDPSPPKLDRKPHLVTNADNVFLPDIDDEQDPSPPKFERKAHLVTKAPKYFTLATDDPILPIEALLPLLPRDNGRGM